MIIALDFDGTVVTHEYPYIGEDIGAVPVLKELTAAGHKLVLFTMRSGKLLDDAVGWFERNGIDLYAINENPEQKSWTSLVKVHANIYMDDCALGCPIRFEDGIRRPFVDWQKVREILAYNRVLPD